MSDPREQLDRLISRYLDDEASAEDRRQLNRLARSDADVDALLDSEIELDREFGYAMRRTMGKSLARRRSMRRFAEPTRLAVLAVAAAIAAGAWIAPELKSTPPRGEKPVAARVMDFSQAPRDVADAFVDLPPRYIRPDVRLDVRPDHREWLVLPARDGAEFLVIQVDRVRTRVVRLGRDF
ncbi:MAG: hypothetical protein KDA32_05605 [Phycisphaerales bacterium]|nr:hypothetical protein [Phycisphaerales bacterium]